MNHSMRYLSSFSMLMLVLGNLTGWLADSALAQGNERVERVFAVAGGNSIPDPDLLGPDARRLVVTGPESFSGFIVFAPPLGSNIPDEEWQIRDAEDNIVFDLRGAMFMIAPTLHVTASGSNEAHEYWWADKVTPGVTCQTGPDGDILYQKQFRIAQIDDSADPNDAAYYPSSSGRRFTVVIAEFNR